MNINDQVWVLSSNNHNFLSLQWDFLSVQDYHHSYHEGLDIPTKTEHHQRGRNLEPHSRDFKLQNLRSDFRSKNTLLRRREQPWQRDSRWRMHKLRLGSRIVEPNGGEWKKKKTALMKFKFNLLTEYTIRSYKLSEDLFVRLVVEMLRKWFCSRERERTNKEEREKTWLWNYTSTRFDGFLSPFPPFFRFSLFSLLSFVLFLSVSSISFFSSSSHPFPKSLSSSSLVQKAETKAIVCFSPLFTFLDDPDEFMMIEFFSFFPFFAEDKQPRNEKLKGKPRTDF